MKTALTQISVLPSVFRVGEEKEITLSPLDPKFAFEEDADYRVILAPRNGYTPRFDESPCVTAAKGRDGKLVFSHRFEKEDAYALRVFKGEKCLWSGEVFALEDDLFALRPLKGDTHVHSCRSDGLDSPSVVAANYRAAGFDFMALTDHRRYEPSVEMIGAYRDIPLGMTLINGEEVHSPDAVLHIVHFGGMSSVNEIFEKDKDRFFREVDEIDRTEKIPFSDEKMRFAYASALWCVREIHRADGIAVFPHPCWIYEGFQNMFNVPNDLSRAFLLNDVFDAFEIVAGQSSRENNFQAMLFYELREEYLEKTGRRIPVALLGASDSHGTVNRGLFDRKFSIVFAPSRQTEDIKNAIRRGMTAAVEIPEADYSRFHAQEEPYPYSVHGSLRLASYAAFLMENYFPLTRQIAFPEGEMMRRASGGENEAKEDLQRVSSRTDDFYRRFFGR